MDGLRASPPEILKLAAHPIRWAVLTRLARSDYRVQELVAFVQLPQNLVSYHLRQLRVGKLVSERKSSADERSIYYSLDLEQFRLLYFQAGALLHPALIAVMLDARDKPQQSNEPLRVLFLCTENSARSQIAEALLRQLSHETIEAFSAGSHPSDNVHPLALRVLEQKGIDTSRVYPKNLAVFQSQQFDVIVSVCDRVREICPTFPNDPERIHWSIPDPTRAESSNGTQYHAFEQIALQLTTRIHLLIALLAREHQYPA